MFLKGKEDNGRCQEKRNERRWDMGEENEGEKCFCVCMTKLFYDIDLCNFLYLFNRFSFKALVLTVTVLE